MADGLVWGSGAGVVSGSYRAPLAAARFSARDCSCMVTQPPSEQSAVSFPPVVVSATLTPGVPDLCEPDLAIRSSACGAQCLESQSCLPASFSNRETKNGFLDASTDDDKRSACISLQHRIDESTNTNTT